MPELTLHQAPASLPKPPNLSEAIQRSRDYLLSTQKEPGYWWFSLEANESIGAGYIQLSHFLGLWDPEREQGLLNHLLTQQREDGAWSLYAGGPGDLSATVEAYFALRLGGYSQDMACLQRARRFILELEHGGLSEVRVFTRIHLALFGLIPWSACPEMPVWLILMPPWSGFSIYEFSSWARASIVPLLVIMDKKPVHPLNFNLDELMRHPLTEQDWAYQSDEGFFSWKNLFLNMDRGLKGLARLPWYPGKQQAYAACERWIREHLERTEDIYPALAYGALALKALGYPNEDPQLKKAVDALQRFQQSYRSAKLPAMVENDKAEAPGLIQEKVHQQCCISPLWDTPWCLTALLASGSGSKDPELVKAGHFLIEKQTTAVRGDWAVKNPQGMPGGWAFEFENDYFPDVDDTVQIADTLRQLKLHKERKRESLQKAVGWILSMQSKNGGWAAFDKNNLADWVNRIPFSDHGACLDPPTPDITARVLGLLSDFNHSPAELRLKRALRFLRRTQRLSNHTTLIDNVSAHNRPTFGAWWGRWGVNYLYGTWCVLAGLARCYYDMKDEMVERTVCWLKAVQLEDGGWGESCAGYRENCFVTLEHGVPSQTAWALLGLIAAGETKDESVQRGIDFLLRKQNSDGTWNEAEFTGTGFPGHFYIRYHGYRHYFPLLALGTYNQETRVARGSLPAGGKTPPGQDPR